MAIRDRSWVWVVVTSAAFASGCGSQNEGAERQWRRTLDALRGGSLVNAYASFIPRSYENDLNDLLVRTKGLVGKEELALVRDLVTKAVNGVSVVLTTMGQKEPALAALGDKLKDLPAALGLDSLESFQRMEVRGLLAAADRTFFRDLVKIEGVRSRITSVKVSLVEEKGNWSKVKFTWREGEGDAFGEREELVELIRQDKKWVPAGWVTEWPRQIGGLRNQIEALAKAKEKDPEAVIESLSVVAAALEEPGKIIEAIVGGMGGGKPAGSRP